MRRALLPGLFLLAAAAALGACREERGAKPRLTDAQRALLAEKADARIESIVTEAIPGPFAALVVFRSDAFIYHSDMLERHDLPVLNVFGNAAILRLTGPEALFLVGERGVRKVRYLCGPGALVRFEPTFEMDVLRRYGDGREADNVAIGVRFRELPTPADEAFVAAAGYAVDARSGALLFLTGPLSGLPRLMEHDGIRMYEQAPPRPTTP